ncbi:unnamed protein product [Darwinula stevensoni]|uniref:Uncharacterized protein n=1 Tax=Darwinula stevensoni TaxID=69355 RepID=A0A7R9A3D8_9CRUS|nr:unnamed protein product [Darwinula stevensoni]CAG0890501.1 unnamed protein product [Darwinula stevensoni]
MLPKDEKKHRVLRHLVRMGSEVVKRFLDVARSMENEDRGSVEKKLHHLRGILGNPHLTTTDFLDNLQLVKDGVCSFAEFRGKLESAVRKKTLTASFASIAQEDEEVIVREFSECITEDALKPYMKLKNAEKSGEWRNYVQICLGGHGTQKTQTTGNIELRIIPGNPMEVTEGSFNQPFCAAVFSNEVVDVDRCLLGLRNHQGRCRGEKKIPIAYVTDSLCEAARIEQALHQHNLKTQSAVLRKAESKGPLFVQAHMHCVIASSSEIPLSTSVIDMKDLLESLGKPNQWILSNVKDLKVSDLPESLKMLSLVELDLVLVGEGKKHPGDAQEDPPDTPKQRESNSNGDKHFEFETEDAIGDITAEEFLENEDTDIFGHDFIHLSSSSVIPLETHGSK